MKTGPRIYNLFPTIVGPIDRWIAQIERIRAMGFDWIYVNPFHVTGYSGSLYAVKDYYRLNELFRGSASASDDELLRTFIDAAADVGIRVMMDLVVNHTARDADLIDTHPQWYRRSDSGEIISPSAVDPGDLARQTVWTDLAQLDYRERPERTELVTYFADVIRHYSKLGIGGFRCDAAYQVPAEVWSALIGAARDLRPDTIFAAETLGAPLEAVLGLQPAGFDFLFNSSKWWDFQADWLLEQYEQFRQIAPSIAFPESHDTPRLATEIAQRSPAEMELEYRFRYLFAAFFSTGVMMPIGYEYGFDRPLDVVMTRPEHWQEPRFDLGAFIAEVNALKASIPALNQEGATRAVDSRGAALALVRHEIDGTGSAVALINPQANEIAAIDTTAVLREIAFGADVTPRVGASAPAALDREILLQPFELRVIVNHGRGHSTARDDRASARAVVIEAVSPQLDGGRHPVKRIVGDRIEVQADIFREGHDAIAAVVKFRECDTSSWRESAMLPMDNDRWSGTFDVQRNTRYVYTVEAWPDAFATWRHGSLQKHHAGQSIDIELSEGEQLVHAATERASGAVRDRLLALIRELKAAVGDARRVLLLSDSLASVMGAAPDRSRSTSYAPELHLTADRRAAQIGAWYELFPRSQGKTPHVHATFAEAAKRLPEVRAMGFDVVYLPPVHPIGRAFRKGRNNSLNPTPSDPGSPWAIGNSDGGHMAVEPALGTLDDFDRFVDDAQAQGLEIALDYALQCSPDHPYVHDHPEWFIFRPDGSIKYAENPPKKYQDIVNFNWFGPHAPELWDELRDVIEFWIGHGVRIFRVDNPHTKPFALWEWLIADVQSRRPDILFLAEAFTRPKIMKKLAKLGFTQSYTYFTWRNTKVELTEYSEELASSESGDYFRPNFFANTPDILPPFLQTGGRPAFQIRLILAATLSSIYGIYSGFELCENAALPNREEYADSEKYEIRVRDWNAPGNIKDDIATINRLRRENVALHDWRNVRFLKSSSESVLFFQKRQGDNILLIAVNLDPRATVETQLHLPLNELGYAHVDPIPYEELLGGSAGTWRGSQQHVQLDPTQRPAVIFRVRLGPHALGETVQITSAYPSPSD